MVQSLASRLRGSPRQFVRAAVSRARLTFLPWQEAFASVQKQGKIVYEANNLEAENSRYG
jgi:hypothetical protein